MWLGSSFDSCHFNSVLLLELLAVAPSHAESRSNSTQFAGSDLYLASSETIFQEKKILVEKEKTVVDMR